MTKEEEAIKYLNLIKMDVNSMTKIGFVYSKQSIETVLSMLKEKDEEVEKKSQIIDEQIRDIAQLRNELNEENKRCIILANNDKFKEQVIGKMACTIYDYANLGKLGICDCELEDGKIDLDLCNQTLADRNCIKCIKQYFSKKVEEE